jgi:hypothetical protein
MTNVMWAVAIERHRPEWVHAYDLMHGRVPHPLNPAYDVHRDLDWHTAVETPRCQHCLEIVGAASGQRPAASGQRPAASGQRMKRAAEAVGQGARWVRRQRPMTLG